MSSRSGNYILQPTGYRAFMPRSLPPDPPLKLDGETLVLLSEADRSIGRLDAATNLLPNPDLFVAMYVRREAVYSSQIEGTQASLGDLLEYEVAAARPGRPDDVREVVNYVRAMHLGFERLTTLPLSLRLIREIHAELLTNVRGGERTPGEFRTSQNWIGPAGAGLAQASYVPPPPGELMGCLGELEMFLHDETPLPILIRCALAHAQFETIHPFLDGNGRMGRLLVTFMLCWQGVLQEPLLYLSEYFKRHRADYYAHLQAVRDEGAWEAWTRFFLTGVRDVSRQAADTAKKIQQLRDQHRALVAEHLSGTTTPLILLDGLFESPITTVNQVRDLVDRSYPVANDLVAKFVGLGLLFEITGQQRNRIYAYRPYLDLVS